MLFTSVFEKLSALFAWEAQINTKMGNGTKFIGILIVYISESSGKKIMLTYLLFPDIFQIFRSEFYFVSNFVPIWSIEGFFGLFPAEWSIRLTSDPNFFNFIYGLYAIIFSLYVHAIIIAGSIFGFNYAKRTSRSPALYSLIGLLIGIAFFEYLLWVIFIYAIILNYTFDIIGYFGIAISFILFLPFIIGLFLIIPWIYLEKNIKTWFITNIKNENNEQTEYSNQLYFLDFIEAIIKFRDRYPYVIIGMALLGLYLGYEQYYYRAYTEHRNNISINANFISSTICNEKFKRQLDISDMLDLKNIRLTHGMSAPMRDYYLGFIITNNSTKSISLLIIHAEVFGAFDLTPNKFSDDPIFSTTIIILEKEGKDEYNNKFRPQQYTRICVKVTPDRDYTEEELSLLRVVSKVEEVKW